jgi:hypothetical protein
MALARKQRCDPEPARWRRHRRVAAWARSRHPCEGRLGPSGWRVDDPVGSRTPGSPGSCARGLSRAAGRGCPPARRGHRRRTGGHPRACRRDGSATLRRETPTDHPKSLSFRPERTHGARSGEISSEKSTGTSNPGPGAPEISRHAAAPRLGMTWLVGGGERGLRPRRNHGPDRRGPAGRPIRGIPQPIGAIAPHGFRDDNVARAHPASADASDMPAHGGASPPASRPVRTARYQDKRASIIET